MLVGVKKGGQRRTFRVPFRMRRAAWLLPWRRSVVPLSWILRRASVRNAVRGELVFVGPTVPVMFIERRGNSDSIARYRGDQFAFDAVPDELFARCGTVDTMSEDNTYRLGGVDDMDALFLRFTSRTRIVG